MKTTTKRSSSQRFSLCSSYLCGYLQWGMTRVYYFAYGSNLLTSYLREYCPSATVVMRATISNFRVEFPYYSEESQGGLSGILESPGELVEGVIFDILQTEFAAMDVMESVPQKLYRRDTFLTLGEDGTRLIYIE